MLKAGWDAIFMRIKVDYMCEAQIKPGYNVQLMIEGEYLVKVDISNARSNQLTTISRLERMERHLGY